MLRRYDPSNNKRGHTCIFYSASHSLRVLNISYICECITFDRNSGNNNKNNKI